MISVPEQYVVQTFYRCVSFPHHNKHTQVYNGSCPFCKEGKSYGKKTRFFYIPKKEIVYCHNCGYSKKPFNFILDVTGKPFNEIINDVKKGDFNVTPVAVKEDKPVTPSLPADCINLNDSNQLQYYKEYPVVDACIQFIKKRGLDTAVNNPGRLYLSLTDVVHKNRLVLPFYDADGNIVFYQTRGLLKSDLLSKPKYLSKVGAEKSLYGIHNLDLFHEYVYIFEGPIDAYFMTNGIAVCGIQEDSARNFNDLQTKQLSHLTVFKKIWCLDNQWNDNAALKKSITLIDAGETVFIWPESLKTFKDLNDVCIFTKKTGISGSFIQKNSYSGLKAKILLTTIKNKRSN